MESEDKSCVLTKTCVLTKEELQSALKTWSASSVNTLDAAEAERQYKLPGPPEWSCIICGELINTSPVYQCQAGHLACHSCAHKGVKCRSCSRVVNRTRNLAVGKMINSLVVTCKFASLGCSEVMKLNDSSYEEHEDNCSFRPMFCPMPGCKGAGVTNLFAQHLLSEHGINCLVDVGDWQYSYGEWEYYGDSEEFDLDSTIAVVMLRNMRFQEFHLLHHQCAAAGDRLEITSLGETCKRKYELVVKVGEEHTYCYKSSTTPNTQPTGGLLIPKQSDGDSLKKRCKVRMPEYVWEDRLPIV